MSDLFSGINSDKVSHNLERALDGAAKRHEIISNNVANVDVPNFKRSDIAFQEELRRAIEENAGSTLQMNTTNGKHIPNVSNNNTDFTVVQENNLTFRNDGNNVDIEKEMVEMTKNNVLYNAYVQLLGQKMSQVKRAISEGK